MTDLISRQQAIDALDCINGVEEVLRSLPSAQPGQRWITCSEKLPEEGVKVLACLKDWQTGESKTVVSYRIDNNYWHGYGRYNEKCVAWMPLPEPYAERRADV